MFLNAFRYSVSIGVFPHQCERSAQTSKEPATSSRDIACRLGEHSGCVLSILYPAKVALFLGESSLRGAWLTQGRLSLDLHTRRLSRVRCPHRLARICTTSRHKGTRSCCPCFPPFGFVVEHGCRQSQV